MHRALADRVESHSNRCRCTVAPSERPARLLPPPARAQLFAHRSSDPVPDAPLKRARTKLLDASLASLVVSSLFELASPSASPSPLPLLFAAGLARSSFDQQLDCSTQALDAVGLGCRAIEL